MRRFSIARKLVASGALITREAHLKNGIRAEFNSLAIDQIIGENMIATITNTVYSGATFLDPKIELTEEASSELFNLFAKISSLTKQKLRSNLFLGSRSFFIYFNNGIYTRSFPNIIELDNKIYSDTENINNYIFYLFSSIIEDS